MALERGAAIITGSSRGIGAAIAARLARDGYPVVINYLNSDGPARELAQMINQTGGQALVIRADVACSAEVNQMVNEAAGRYGRVEVLVNNAGVVRDALVQNMFEGDWDEVIRTNLKGVFICSKAVLKIMRRHRRGRIINISSLVGQRGAVGQANYAASKAGIIAFSKSLALEAAPYKITVNVVTPGFTGTDMTSGLPERARAGIMEKVILGRPCSPGDVAGMVSYLVSDQAGYISGQVFNVDCRII